MLSHRALLLHLTRAAWLDRYAGSALGMGWALLWPLVQLAIFLVVFSGIMGARLGDLEGKLGRFSYGVYLAAGMVPWWVLSNGLARISGVFLEQRGLLTKIALPLALVPLPVLLAEALVALVLLGFLGLFLAVLGQLPATVLWLALAMPGLLLLTYGAGLALAVLTVFLEDVREGLQVVLQLGFWLTPIVYVSTILPPWIQGWLAYNPAAWAVESFHAALVFGQAPPLKMLAALWGCGLAATGTGLWLLRRCERTLRDLL